MIISGFFYAINSALFANKLSMKKTLLIIAGLMSIAAVQAQNYYYLAKQSGGNPGGLNTEMDQLNNASGGGWTLIMGQTASPAYSAVQNLPAGFNFKFAGNAVTQFKASSTGYITFNTAASNTPVSAAEALPSTNLPDKTISIWGMTATGTNDMVLSKTFGTAPNRQFWIKFQSMTTPGDAANSFTYWSIVLEESTNTIYLVGMNWGQSSSNYTSPKHSLGIQIDGTTAVNIAGSPNITNTAPLDETYGNNFYYEFIYGVQPSTDVKVSGFVLPILTKVGSDYDVKVSLSNRGSQPVNSLDLMYSLNGGAPVKTSLSSLGLQANLGNAVQATATAKVAANPVGTMQKIVVWVENVNGGSETVKSNDTNRSYTVINNGAGGGKKRVMLEEGTGAWCQHCPDAHSYLKNIKNTNGSNVIVIAHHNADGMAGAGDSINRSYLAGYPGGTIDRYFWADKSAVGLSRGDWNSKVTAALAMSTPVDVSVSSVDLNTSSKKLSWKVKVKFYDYFGANDVRIGGMAVENNVRGTGSGYDQIISSTYTSNMTHAYYNFSSPMIGYYHDNVSVGVPSGVWGAKLPTTAEVIKPGDSFEVTFTHTYANILGTVNMPSTAQFTPKGGTVFANGKPVDMRAVGFVSLFTPGLNDRKVLNAHEQWLWNQSAGTRTPVAAAAIRLYPNPAAESAGISWEQPVAAQAEISVMNMAGQVVQQSLVAGVSGSNESVINLKNLNNGVYLVKLTVGGTSVSSKLIVAHD